MDKNNQNLAANTRTVFFVSDRTAITAEALGNSLLTQFETINFKKIHLSFIDSPEKAKQAAKQIQQTSIKDNKPALVFSTQVDKNLIRFISKSNCIFFDFFNTFIFKMENALNASSSHTAGRLHGIINNDNNYYKRMESINFAINSDDGVAQNYDSADIIIIGVSRSGKTPTCVYMALKYSIKASNYPLTEDDLSTTKLPKILKQYKNKLFGLTINPTRLQKIRAQRMNNSKYASLQQCRQEVRLAEDIYQANNITFLNTTQISIEEITAKIADKFSLR